MPDGGEGGGVQIIGVGVIQAVFHQVTKAALAEAFMQALRHVAAQLIDGEQQHQTRFFRRVGMGQREQDEQKQAKQARHFLRSAV